MLEAFIGQHLFSGHSTNNEFVIVDVAGAIEINTLDQRVDFLLIEVDALDLSEAGNQLFSAEGAVSILIESLELLLESINLSLCQEVLNEKGVHRLLQTRARMESFKGQ